jgi:hypothetical protein
MQIKRPRIVKPEYRIGAEARKNFEETMQKLFRVPKTAVTKKPKKGENEK